MTKKSSCRLNIRATGGTIVVKHCIQHAGSCVCSCKSVTGKVLCFSRISSSGTLWISHTPPRQSQDNSGRWRREDSYFFGILSLSLCIWSGTQKQAAYQKPRSPTALKVTSSVKWVGEPDYFTSQKTCTKISLEPNLSVCFSSSW